ncbi:catechol 2,3-dioxygenase-like lactoylglutathione lyase family enzyme [Rhodovulum iodosum]|uniref:Catechol 2,3-dioxygenase-like lactoylglutathione lyase family enzyme n=1 Tax=Rhodovulum iodosum TaxID=68291 RepID=A0ABV3XV50_9RHOB|nr:VOC family protein [Rhodovulum robiginosum]RSK33602.1 glyoxalase/bleomycin resistance/extradiol dioxygenase family protein [Rhodovulum robiginosum]
MSGPALPPADPLGPVLEAALYAGDLDAAEAFYGGVLGLERIVRVGRRHVFFRAGHSVVLIFNPDETCKPPAPGKLPVPPHGAHGPGHLCLSAGRAAIARWRTRLVAAGHDVEAEFDWPNGARSLYFRDPAGNSLELAEPRLWFSR